MEEVFLPLKEIKRKYRLSVKTLLRLELEGRIKVLKTPGGHRRYSEKELISTMSEARELESKLVHVSIHYDNYQTMPHEIRMVGSTMPDLGIAKIINGNEPLEMPDADLLWCFGIYRKLPSYRRGNQFVIEGANVRFHVGERILLPGNKDTGIYLQTDEERYKNFKNDGYRIDITQYDLSHFIENRNKPRSWQMRQDIEVFEYLQQKPLSEFPPLLYSEEVEKQEDGSLCMKPIIYELCL